MNFYGSFTDDELEELDDEESNNNDLGSKITDDSSNDNSNDSNNENNEDSNDQNRENENDKKKSERDAKIAKLNAERAKQRRLYQLNQLVATIRTYCPVCNASLFKKPFYYMFKEGKKKPVLKKYKSFKCDVCRAEFKNKIDLPKKKKKKKDDEF